jgi:hypothetical protein
MTDFGELEMGFKHDAAGNHEIVGKITLIDSSPLSSHGGAVNFFMDDQQNFHVQVHFGPTEASFVYILVLFSRRRLPSFCLYKMDFSVGNMVPFQ